MTYSIQEGEMEIEVGISTPKKDVWYVCPNKVKETAAIDVVPFDLDQARKGRFLVRKKGAKYKPFDDLLEHLEKFKNRSKGYGAPLITADFCVYNPKTIECKYELPGEKGIFAIVGKAKHNDETGFLGELATDLTFFVHGFTKLFSKLNAQGNGFDGVFVDNNAAPTRLWITETKFRSRPMNDPELMAQLDTKLSSDGALVKYKSSENAELNRVAALIERFIKEIPEKIVLLGQTSLTDGLMRSCMDIYSERYKVKKVLSSKSSEKEKNDYLAEFIYEYVTLTGETDEILAQRLLAAAGLSKKFTLAATKKPSKTTKHD